MGRQLLALVLLVCCGCDTYSVVATKLQFPRAPEESRLIEALEADEAVLSARSDRGRILIELQRPAISVSGDHHSFAEVEVKHGLFSSDSVRLGVFFFNYDPRGLEREEWKLLLARLRYRIAEHCRTELERYTAQ